MSPLGPDAETEPEDDRTSRYDMDRRRLLRTANRLTVAFWAWAIVVVVIGGYNSMLQRDIQEDMRFQRHDIVELQRKTDLIYERQSYALSRLGKLEDALEAQREHLRRQQEP